MANTQNATEQIAFIMNAPMKARLPKKTLIMRTIKNNMNITINIVNMSDITDNIKPSIICSSIILLHI